MRHYNDECEEALEYENDYGHKFLLISSFMIATVLKSTCEYREKAPMVRRMGLHQFFQHEEEKEEQVCLLLLL